MITVGDVLALPVFESVRLAAPCEGFAGRPVVNAGILDEEPPANGYREFFPNEFILSSLGFARRDPALAERAIVSVMECGVAALAIKPAAQNAIGPRVIELSERRGIPILFYEGRYYEQILSSFSPLFEPIKSSPAKAALSMALWPIGWRLTSALNVRHSARNGGDAAVLCGAAGGRRRLLFVCGAQRIVFGARIVQERLGER